MKVKVSFFDRSLLKDYSVILSGLGMIFTFGSVLISIPKGSKPAVAVILLCFFAAIYVGLWVRANRLRVAKISINNSTVEVKIGDLFKQAEFKVIAFNEYFDTLVDDEIIAERTLNGVYIKRVLQNGVFELDRLIDERLAEKITGTNEDRKKGKQKRYELGTILKHGDYLLTAFSRFDSDNRAFLFMKDYINFLLNFWNEVDRIYNGRSVSLPLLGSGITRFKEYPVTEQELLELLVWSFKISRIKFTYPSRVSIIIDESRRDKINFYKLKELSGRI